MTTPTPNPSEREKTTAEIIMNTPESENEESDPIERCNVCGRELLRSDEKAIGACAVCMNEEVYE